jgi:hypothetical protein
LTPMRKMCREMSVGRRNSGTNKEDAKRNARQRRIICDNKYL